MLGHVCINKYSYNCTKHEQDMLSVKHTKMNVQKYWFECVIEVCRQWIRVRTPMAIDITVAVPCYCVTHGIYYGNKYSLRAIPNAQHT